MIGHHPISCPRTRVCAVFQPQARCRLDNKTGQCKPDFAGSVFCPSRNLPFLSQFRPVNSRASKFPVLRVTGFMNSILVSLEAETADLPLAELDGCLPRRVFSMRPTLTEALEAHAVYPPGLLLPLILSIPLFDARIEVRACIIRLTHGVHLFVTKLPSPAAWLEIQALHKGSFSGHPEHSVCRFR